MNVRRPALQRYVTDGPEIFRHVGFVLGFWNDKPPYCAISAKAVTSSFFGTWLLQALGVETTS